MKSLGKFPDPFIAEIAGQPGALRRAAAALSSQVEALERVAEAAADASTMPVFTGMGSSYFACYPAVIDLSAAGVPSLHLDTAELLHFRAGVLDERSVVVAVSQSGRSAELVRLADRVAGGGPTLISVTNGLDTPLAMGAEISFDTGAGEEVGPSTMTFAAALVVVAGIGSVLSGERPHEVVGRLGREAEEAAGALERVLADGSLPGRLADHIGDRGSVVLLARGPARAAAEMGALTLKEAVGLAAESLEAAQFRHGPLEIAGPGLAAIVIATEPETRELDLGLARELVDAGAAVVLVTEDDDGPDGAVTVRLGAIARGLRPAVSIAPAQLLAWQLAIRRGREPGSYVQAAKVTTRE
jgi:glucosamine--fructose-6-phosphate aminotransferase (isomerizing)